MNMNRYVAKSFNRHVVELSNSESNAPAIAAAKPLERFNGLTM